MVVNLTGQNEWKQKEDLRQNKMEANLLKKFKWGKMKLKKLK